MNINYVEKDISKISLNANKQLNIELVCGEKFEDLTPRKMFPHTKKNLYISLVNQQGKEIVVIKDISNISDDNRETLLQALDNYYFVPKIDSIKASQEKNGIVNIKAATDCGDCEFNVFDIMNNVKLLCDYSVLIRDTNDNRYEIPDIRRFDKKTVESLYL